MPRVSFPSMKYLQSWRFGVAKPTSISLLRIHCIVQIIRGWNDNTQEVSTSLGVEEGSG